MPTTPKRNAPAPFKPRRLMLPALVLSLTGCATSSPPVCPPPVLPPAPVLLQPIPPVSYSLSVQRSLQDWQKRLTATPPTPER